MLFLLSFTVFIPNLQLAQDSVAFPALMELLLTLDAPVRTRPTAKKNPESLCSQRMNRIACFCRPESVRKMDFRSSKVHVHRPNASQQ